MNKLRIVLFVFVALFVGNIVCAQNNVSAPTKDEVTLVVSADGVSKDEATKTALRSAIEQAYGTFVSANTTILNDELVKDEIVTVASGNIKSYNEIACEQMPDGKTFVTLQATVSISKLVSYAQSKGAETEFAGASFGMNIKMKELNKQNEKKALENMFAQLKTITPFDIQLKLEDPKIGERKDVYEVDGDVCYLYNNSTKLFNDIVYKTLSSLSLSEQERLEYDKIGLHYYEFNYAPLDHDKTKFYLRNDSIQGELEKIIIDKTVNVVISDNISSPSKLDIIMGWRSQYYNEIPEIHENVKIRQIYGEHVLPMQVIAHYRMMVRSGYKEVWDCLNIWSYLHRTKTKLFGKPTTSLVSCYDMGERMGVLPVKITIPQADISQYTNFKVELKG